MKSIPPLFQFAFVTSIICGLAGCVTTPDIPSTNKDTLTVGGPATVTIDCDASPASFFVESMNLVPEGIEFDPETCRFLLGSISSGNVVAVNDDGSFSALTNDDQLAASTGLHLDGRRLLVCAQLASGAPGFGIYNADDGSRIALIDLTDVAGAGSHMINDCTVDSDGNAYVTDSMSTKIYRVTPQGDASVLLDDATFASSGVSLNGIEYIPDADVLVVVVTGQGKLYRIPLADPSAFTQVTIDASIAGDGMCLHPSGDLVVVGSFSGNSIGSQTGVAALTSDDNWQSASVGDIVTTSVRGTTAALRGTDVYVTFAFITQFFTGTTVDRYPLLLLNTEQ